MAQAGRKAAFIDRDGVINEERSYVHRIADFVFLPGTVDALHRLQTAGYRLVVITNQSGIARGLYSYSAYREVEAHMRDELARAGVSLDLVQHCPHLPDATIAQYRLDCQCRKPRPGMLLEAKNLLDLDLPGSILVGDRRSDIEAGRAAGVGRCYLVRSGHPVTAEDARLADAVYDGLEQCVEGILGTGRSS